jgi:non-lysosomal glucosylceramidase
MQQQEDGLIPKYGWTKSITDTNTPALRPFTIPFSDIWHFAGLGIRFFTGYYMKHKLWEGKLPTFDPFVHNISPAEQKGPPLGGIGSGVMTRSWQGDFTRWGLKCGQYHNKIVHANQFSLCVKPVGGDESIKPSAVVLNYSNQEQSAKNSLRGWNWWRTNEQRAFDDMTGTFTSLYPCSYSQYSLPSQNLEVECKQFSPVIAHNYKESSYPVTCFKWNVRNTSNQAVNVSIMFTFQNGTGEATDSNGTHWNQSFSNGVNLHNKISYTKAQVESNTAITDDLVFTIAGNKNVTVCPGFQTSDFSSSQRLWNKFAKTGKLQDVTEEKYQATNGTTIGAAVCIELTIPPNSSDEAVFTLSWDLPITRFGQSSYYKKYTQFYPPGENVSQTIAMDALNNYAEWENMVNKWQHPILSDQTLPDWYKSALFNELYYVVDGGTVWTNGGAIQNDGTFDANDEHFSYIEGHEYIMFTTYDVHFYASYALIMNWPQIQLTIQRDYAKSALFEYDQTTKWCGSGVTSKRKVKNCIPHDLGTTAEKPFYMVNSYHIQDVNHWKDLNPMFILSSYRDYFITKDETFLRDIYPVVVKLIDYHLTNFDKDNDGLIENEGFPDTTYDAWVCTGPSAFSGGLWISALSVAHHMAQIIGDSDNEKQYLDLCNRATAVYEEKLWDDENGYYHYDANAGRDSAYRSDTIMSDQLCGHAFLKAVQLPPLLKQERIHRALDKIYQYNVVKYREITGNGGAVNGMKPTGEIDTSLLQCREVWTGTSYLLASLMIHENMLDQAMDTAKGVYDTCMKLGFWFQTPEAYNDDGSYRSLGYMRPLSIWSMQLAHENNNRRNRRKQE